MRFHFCLSAAVALLLMATQSRAQIPNPITFEDSTDNGFGLKFGNDASATFTVANIGGSNRMLVPRTGAFQEADTSTGNPASGFYQAMLAAMANPSGYNLSYDYYLDTSTFGAGAGTFRGGLSAIKGTTQSTYGVEVVMALVFQGFGSHGDLRVLRVLKSAGIKARSMSSGCLRALYLLADRALWVCGFR